MKTAMGFMKKEWMEYIRTAKLTILAVVFALFGLMNPAMAKLTPKIIEMMSETMETAGMTITSVTADGTMSWGQFYKNIPTALIVLVFLMGGILVNELQKGTLIPVLTKGLSRWKVFLVKAFNLAILWTGGYFLCFGITWFYTEYYWPDSLMKHTGFAVLCYWLFGLMIVALMMLFSAMSSSLTGVLLGTGGVYFAMTMIGIVPKAAKYLPTYLTGASSLAYSGEVADYGIAVVMAIVITVGSLIGGSLIFSKRGL